MSTETERLRIGLIGANGRWGPSAHIPAIQHLSQTELYAVCTAHEDTARAAAEKYSVEMAYWDDADMLANTQVEAVAVIVRVPIHYELTMNALRAGKHVMCTVPMATTIAECEELCQAVNETGLKYMMAETVVYSREFLFIKELYDKGELGKLQYLAASHPQDMDGWPSYWEAMIPMHYATHVVSPCLGMVDGLAEYVSCFGSGTVREDIAQKSGNKFAVESCHIKIKDSDLSAHIWRFLYDVARQYRESIDVYGTKKSFEWTLTENDPHILHVAKRPEAEIPERVEVPDFAHLLPEPIQKFTQSIEDADHLSFVQGGGHGGSHPHMVNEFFSALVEDRDPWPNAKTAANWTCVGICAHQSAEQGGNRVDLPAFTL